MKFQAKPGWCGPAAIVNALRCFGVRIRQDIVAKSAGASVLKGTDERGIKKALSELGYSFSVIKERKYADAEAALIKHLKHSPSIILTEDGNHWELALGVVGERVIIVDSQNLKFNKLENGVHVIPFGKPLRDYWSPYEGHRYAINVLQKPE